MPLRLFKSVPMKLSAAGYSFAERTSLSRQYSLSPVEKFVGGVIDTGENLSPVSMKPPFFPGVIDTGQK